MQNTIKRDLIQSIKVGFGFGILFSLTSHFAGFPIESFVLWVIPFIAGVLSALGSLVAGAVAVYLQQKWFLQEGKASALGFIAAAGVNAFTVILLLGLLGSAPLHRNVIMALVLGLSFGGIYALYAYRINRMDERMAFLETLAEKNKRIQEATRTIAIIQERNRMSRELHDSISQGLHGIYFSLHSLRKELSDPSAQVSRILNHLEETLQATQDELRAVIDELKPSLLTEKGLEQSLKYLGDLLAHRQQIRVSGSICVGTLTGKCPGRDCLPAAASTDVSRQPDGSGFFSGIPVLIRVDTRESGDSGDCDRSCLPAAYGDDPSKKETLADPGRSHLGDRYLWIRGAASGFL
ncbi:MAG: histidine kinase [Bacillota bacterium]|nr:histidine kinase [Bacillota bacterium]MDW7678322.1 histidine kinase [Bacillota bacterium]